jgi:hypothetical protein
MKYAKWISILGLLILPALAAAQMKQTDRIAVKVPFNFVVGDTAVPGGEIILQRADLSGRVLAVRNVDAKLNVFATTSGEKATARTGEYLVFRKYGNRYVLKSLKVDGSNEMYAFAPGKLEAEMTAQNRSDEEIVVAGSK